MWAQEYWIEEDERPPRSGGLVTGLLVGAALGAAASLLLAPRGGAELRSRVKSSVQRFGRRAAEAYDGVSHAIGDVAARSRRAVGDGRGAAPSTRSAEPARDPARVPLP
jgi:gas vesicle protein